MLSTEFIHGQGLGNQLFCYVTTRMLAHKLGYNFDYDDKPSSKGYPNDPPPEMVNGWHPEYGQRDAMYNKMDPQSAQVMQRVKKLEKVKAVVKKSKETP